MEEINCSSAIIINNKREILLQKKDLGYKRSPGSWALFGGIIKPSETSVAALKRELLEEIGIKLEARLFKVYSYKEKTRKGKLYVYYVYFNHPPSLIKLGEGAGFAFYHEKELELLKILKVDFKALKDYFKL